MRNFIKYGLNSFKMIYIAKYCLLALAAAFLMISCSEKDDVGNSTFPTDGVIRVSANIENPASRAGLDTDLFKQRLFYLNIVNPNNSNYSYFAEMIYSSTSNSWESYIPSTRTDNVPLTMLWQNATQHIKVAAIYSPGIFVSNSNFVDGFRINIYSDQSSSAYLNHSDFLSMLEKEVNPATDLVNGKIPIVLKHINSKINLKIKIGTEFTLAPNAATSNPITSVVMPNLFYNATYKITDGSLLPYGASNLNLTMCPTVYTPATASANSYALYECIVIPQTIAANEFAFNINIGSKTYRWVSPTSITFESGKQYSIELNVGKDAVTLGAITIGSAWRTDIDESNIETE